MCIPSTASGPVRHPKSLTQSGDGDAMAHPTHEKPKVLFV